MGVVVFHGLAVAALSNAGLRQRLEAVVTPVEVRFIEAPLTAHSPPPLAPKHAEVLPVDLVLPVFDLPADAPVPVATMAPPRSPPSAAPSLAAVDAAVVVDVVEYLRPPKPRYPAAAKSARVQGVVMLRVLIDREGRPCEVGIHRSSGSTQLDAAARESVLGALFRPYRENGEARFAQVIVPVEFSLTLRTGSRS